MVPEQPLRKSASGHMKLSHWHFLRASRADTQILSCLTCPVPCSLLTATDALGFSASNFHFCRWAWITSLPYVSSGNAQASDQTLDILIKGEALSAITQGRVLAYGCNWYPVRLLDPPLDPPPLPKRSLRRPGFLDWLASQVSEAGPEPILRAEVVIPMAIAAQVRI